MMENNPLGNVMPTPSLFSGAYGKFVRNVTLKEIDEWIIKGSYRINPSNDIRSIVESLRAGGDPKQKNFLPAITTSSIQDGTTHGYAGFLKHTGLMQVDFDKLDDVADIKDVLTLDKYTLRCFYSPTGSGVKAIIPVTQATNKEEHEATYEALVEYYQKNYGLFLDPACINLTRLLFLSYDPELFINNEAEIFIARKFKKKPAAASREYIATGTEAEIVEYCIQQIIEQKLDITGKYSKWLAIGFAIAETFGADGRQYFHDISQFGNYDYEDCDKQYTNCCRQCPTDKKADFQYLLNYFRIAKLKLPASAMKIVPHSEIFEYLLKQIIPVNFQAIIFPEADAIKKSMADLSEKFNNLVSDDYSQENAKEYKKLEAKLKKMTPKDKDKIIAAIDIICQLAENNGFGFCKNGSYIYIFNGAYWKNYDEEEFKLFLMNAAIQLGIPKTDAKYYEFIEKLHKQFLATKYLKSPETDVDKVLINMQNGTLEISATGNINMREFRQNDFLTYQLKFEYNPLAEAPIFQHTYLDKVLPDSVRQMVIAEYLGSVFLKNGNNFVKEEKALFLYGGGENGKSVLFHIVEKLLGSENITNYSLAQLSDERGYFVAGMSSKIINYASELSNKMDTELFKKLVSGEPVVGRFPGEKPFPVTQYAKLIFNCNNLPKDIEHTHGFFRRLLIVPFDVTIAKEERDKNLHNKIIQNELPGVLNWVLTGLQRLIKQKEFTISAAVEEIANEYRTDNDSVIQYLNAHNLVTGKDECYPLRNIYKQYNDFCQTEYIAPMFRKNFKQRLKQLGFKIQPIRKYGNVDCLYCSIKLDV